MLHAVSASHATSQARDDARWLAIVNIEMPTFICLLIAPMRLGAQIGLDWLVELQRSYNKGRWRVDYYHLGAGGEARP